MNSKEPSKEIFGKMRKTTQCFVYGCTVAMTMACRIQGAETLEEDDPCIFEERALDSEQIVAGRFRVGDFIGGFPPSVTFSSQWQTPTDEYFIDSIEGITSTIHVEVKQVPGDLVLHVGYSPEDGEAMPAATESPELFSASESCNTAIYIPVKVKIATEDGLLNEEFETALEASPFGISFSHSIEGKKVRGTVLNDTKGRESIELTMTLAVNVEEGWFSLHAAKYYDDMVIFQGLADRAEVPAKMDPIKEVSQD